MNASAVIPAPSRPLAGRLVLVAAATCVFALLAWQQRSLERAAGERAAVIEQFVCASPQRPTAEVAQALVALKLVTVEIESTVVVSSFDSSWRGEVEATVEAPVKLMYGTNLSWLDARHVAFSPVGGMYVIRVPRPTRIATEVYAEAERASVKTGWLRFRTRAGEYQLGLARRLLNERARAMVLSPDDAARVADKTREQVATLVRSIAGPEARVDVVFEDNEPVAPTPEPVP